MKELLNIAGALFITALFCSCGNSTVSKFVDIIEDGTETVSKVKSYDQLLKADEKIQQEVAAYQSENAKELSKAAEDPEERAKMEKAINGYMQAVMAQAMSLNPVKEEGPKQTAKQDSLEKE